MWLGLFVMLGLIRLFVRIQAWQFKQNYRHQIQFQFQNNSSSLSHHGIGKKGKFPKKYISFDGLIILFFVFCFFIL